MARRRRRVPCVSHTLIEGNGRHIAETPRQNKHAVAGRKPSRCALGSVFVDRIISGGLGELVGPGVVDRMAIDVLDTGHDALLELVLRCLSYRKPKTAD